MLFHLHLGQLHNHFNFLHELFARLLVASLELALICDSSVVKTLLHLGDGVEFALTVDLGLDIVDLVVSRLEVVLHFLQDLLDGFLVGLCVVPLND